MLTGHWPCRWEGWVACAAPGCIGSPPLACTAVAACTAADSMVGGSMHAACRRMHIACPLPPSLAPPHCRRPQAPIMHQAHRSPAQHLARCPPCHPWSEGMSCSGKSPQVPLPCRQPCLCGLPLLLPLRWTPCAFTFTHCPSPSPLHAPPSTSQATPGTGRRRRGQDLSPPQGAASWRRASACPCTASPACRPGPACCSRWGAGPGGREG